MRELYYHFSTKLHSIKTLYLQLQKLMMMTVCLIHLNIWFSWEVKTIHIRY